MSRLRVAIIDLVTRGPKTRVFSKFMNPNYASIMPQAVAVWCEELGHEVRYVCYTGPEPVVDLADETDLLFLGGFTRSALTAYALSTLFRQKGAITALGGPHARCYPQDASKYFDYVLGITDKPQIEELLLECQPHRPSGRQLCSERLPSYLPGVRERWKFIEPTIAKAPAIKIVPMIGSLGCPYTCNFCIDSVIPYQPFAFDQIKEDLRFLVGKLKRPKVGWHDPNFGIRFDDYLTAIEDAVEPGRVEFIAESSLALLSEPNVKRLAKNGFVGMLPGIESWYEYGNKSKTRNNTGEAKVEQVSGHINMILRYVPFVQTNFLLGLDCDAGEEPFELTKKFIDLTPGAYPAFSLLTSYGQAAPLNLELQRANRVLPFPFHFLDSNYAMNVTPANYGWKEFYDLAADVNRHTLSVPTMYRRFKANGRWMLKLINFVRAAASDRARYLSRVAQLYVTDQTVRRYFDGESRVLPEFYRARIKKTLGPLWNLLPEGALEHDQNAFYHSQLSAGVSSATEESQVFSDTTQSAALDL